MTGLKTHFIGDSCICWSTGEDISEQTSEFILNTYAYLQGCELPGIRDFVPSYSALAVHYDPLVIDLKKLRRIVNEAFKKAESSKSSYPSKTYTIPVIYNGPDLHRLENVHGVNKEELIKIHTKPSYTVAMIGFQPHFPYLIGLDKRLITPRLETPRNRVPAGSVAIGGAQTGIYPSESPGGWNLIGITDPECLEVLKPADKIRFKEVAAL